MVVVFGSINVDLTFRLAYLPSVGETVLTPTFTQAVGGKGANQAAAAARDGAATRFIGCVGADDHGATARAALQDLGCDIAQGFHFARPMPGEDVGALLDRVAILPARAAGVPSAR